MTQELQVIADYYTLSTALLQRIQKFPRNLRHGLGRSLELRLENILALLIRAKYAPRRVITNTSATIPSGAARFAASFKDRNRED